VQGEHILDEARALLDQARSGEDVTGALAAHYEAVQALPDTAVTAQDRYAVERAMCLALLAGTDRDHLGRLVQQESSSYRYRNIGQPQALLLRDGDPLHTLIPDNPWRIPPSATLDEAITQVWGGVAERIPGFLAELRHRVLGIALLDDTEYGPLLSYLLYHELEPYHMPADVWAAPRPARDRRAALAWEPYADFCTFIGHAPAEHAPHGVVVPAPLREFYRVHAELHGGMWSLFGSDQLTPLTDMRGYDTPRPVPTEDPTERHLSSDLVYIFSYGDGNGDVLDLGTDADNPPVRTWGVEGYLYVEYDGPLSFWEWFEDKSQLFLAYFVDDDDDDDDD
jgi:hypothetical protein